MVPTPTDEVRAIRCELAARSGDDIHRIAEETRRRQLASGNTYLSLPARPPRCEDGPTQTLQQTPAVA